MPLDTETPFEKSLSLGPDGQPLGQGKLPLGEPANVNQGELPLSRDIIDLPSDVEPSPPDKKEKTGEEIDD